MDDRNTDDAISAVGRSHLQHDRDALKRFNADVIAEFRANEGRVGGPFAGADILLLTLTGAKSGVTRSTPMEYLSIDGRVVVIGSFGGAPRDPAWVHNLRAHPEVRAELGTERYPGLAREVVGDERAAVFTEIVHRAPRFAEYQAKTRRPLPVFELDLHRREH